MPRPNRESKTKGKPAPKNASAQQQPTLFNGKPQEQGRPGHEAPKRNGKVGVCVDPLANAGCGVIKILSINKDGKELLRHYLLRSIGWKKFELTNFRNETGKDHSDIYVVSLAAVTYCGCDDWKHRRVDCKHIEALKALITQSRL